MKKKEVTIGWIQAKAEASVENNLNNTLRKIEEAAQKGAQIICLQELFCSLYFCDVENYQNFELAESMEGKIAQELQKVAQKCNIVLIASLFEKRAKGLFHNSTLVINSDGNSLGFYRKMHIPDDPGYYEKFYFTPGDLGYKVFETHYCKIGVLICWDQWYPEAARITALMGADILFYPTAIGWDVEEKEESITNEQYSAWETIQRAHAIANGVYVVSVNRVGREANQQFWGGSFVANPQGTILQKSSHTEETIGIQVIDLAKIEYYRTTWPFLRDRRIDSYAPILKRFID